MVQSKTGWTYRFIVKLTLYRPRHVTMMPERVLLKAVERD